MSKSYLNTSVIPSYHLDEYKSYSSRWVTSHTSYECDPVYHLDEYKSYLNTSVIPSYHLDEYKSYLNTSVIPSYHLDEHKSYLNTSVIPSYHLDETGSSHTSIWVWSSYHLDEYKSYSSRWWRDQVIPQYLVIINRWYPVISSRWLLYSSKSYLNMSVIPSYILNEWSRHII